MEFDKSGFEARLSGYLAGVTEKVIEGYKRYESLKPPRIAIEVGARYVRVVKVETNDMGVVGSRSVHTFVDRTNGNVLKAEGYKKPSLKNPRSNIFDEDFGLSGVTEYGAVYLK